LSREPPGPGYLGEDTAQGTARLLEKVDALHRFKRRQLNRNMNWDLFPRDEFHSP